uniref:Uncharacterized protein n=1 Tax=Sphaerodactylus townsendi TaxID=933632 RepID=A0ACB8G1J8_9SAUR
MAEPEFALSAFLKVLLTCRIKMAKTQCTVGGRGGEQVLQWRAQQKEAASLEAAIAACRKEEEDEEAKFQKEKEMLRRGEDKEKV